MLRLRLRAGFALAFMATAMSMTWAGTSVLARFTDSVPVGANTFTTASSFCVGSTAVIQASADAYVVETSSGSGSPPDEEHGSASYTSFYVQTPSGDRQHSLVNFALPTVPAGCSITSATLAVTTISGATGRILTATRAATSWTEAVTWNTGQPATTGTAATAASTATVNAVVSWTVTSQVQAMYPSSAFGFVVKDSVETWGSGTQRYHSRTGTVGKRPTLTVVIG